MQFHLSITEQTVVTHKIRIINIVFKIMFLVHVKFAMQTNHALWCCCMQ